MQLKPCIECGALLPKSKGCSWPSYNKRQRCIKCHTTRVRSNLSRKGGKPGKDAPSWRGGLHLDHRGYLRRWVGVGKREYEHRLIMEKHLGRKLKFEEVVHHINFIKTDNRLDNLMIVSRSEHQQLHRQPHLVNATERFSSQG